MKSVFFILLSLLSFNTQANVISISPQNPVVLFVNRSIDYYEIQAPNTMIQIYVSNHLSNEDLVIGNISVITPYDINGSNYSIATEDVKPYVFTSKTASFDDNFEYTIPAGTNSTLGSSNDTWFVVSNMLGLGGKSYFGNQYNAVISNKFTVVVAGYYVDQMGIPTKNFKEEITLDILTF